MKKVTIEKILKFRDDRNWKQFHTGENLVKALNIEASELLELYQWKSEITNIDKLKEELADVLIYAILISETYKLDLEEIIEAKIKLNEEKYPIDKSFGNSKKYSELI